MIVSVNEMAEVRDVHYATWDTSSYSLFWVGLTQVWKARVFLQQAKILDVSQWNNALLLFTLSVALAIPCNR